LTREHFSIDVRQVWPDLAHINPSKEDSTCNKVAGVHLSTLRNWISMKSSLKFKGRLHCFSMQTVMYKCFLLNPGKKFSADSAYRFWEKRINSEKWRHRAEG